MRDRQCIARRIDFFGLSKTLSTLYHLSDLPSRRLHGKRMWEGGALTINRRRRSGLLQGCRYCDRRRLSRSKPGKRIGYADLTKEQRDKMTPDEIIEEMKAGNERFRSGKPRHRDLMSEVKATAKGQYPAAIVFSCVNSRAPAELVLDFGIGDIFSSRVAGNIADEDIMGSMEFACKVAGAKVVVVMGHTACGAIISRVQSTECSLAISQRYWRRFVRRVKLHTTQGSARPRTTRS
jgi:Carbonic anhydrase